MGRKAKAGCALIYIIYTLYNGFNHNKRRYYSTGWLKITVLYLLIYSKLNNKIIPFKVLF